MFHGLTGAAVYMHYNDLFLFPIAVRRHARPRRVANGRLHRPDWDAASGPGGNGRVALRPRRFGSRVKWIPWQSRKHSQAIIAKTMNQKVRYLNRKPTHAELEMGMVARCGKACYPKGGTISTDRGGLFALDIVSFMKKAV